MENLRHIDFDARLDLTGHRALVVGADEAATDYISKLVGSGAAVDVVAMHVTQRVRLWAEAGHLHWKETFYSERYLDGIDLVVAATSDELLDALVYSDASKREIPCVELSGWSARRNPARNEHVIDLSAVARLVEAGRWRRMKEEAGVRSGWVRARAVFQLLRPATFGAGSSVQQREFWRELTAGLPDRAEGYHADVRAWIDEAAASSGLDLSHIDLDLLIDHALET